MKKIVLISGASSGIGLATATKLSKKYEVIGFARKTIEEKVPFQYFNGIDVTDKNSIKLISKKIDAKRVYGIVACAGIASMNHFYSMPFETRRRIIDVNFHGAVNMVECFSKHMIRNKEGRILGISTIAVPLNLEGEATYAASKAALETYLKTIANEVADWGITSNAIRPAATDTFLLAGLEKSQVDGVIKRQTIKTKITPSDTANLIKFLLSNKAKMITGQSITLGLAT